MLAIVGAILIFKRNENGKWSPKELVMGAMCIAVAFVLSFIRIWHMPQGGSLTLVSMLPIMLFAFVYGAPKGALVGLAYGLLQLLQDAFVVHWAQLAMDYVFAFTLLCLAGLFQKKMWMGRNRGRNGKVCYARFIRRDLLRRIRRYDERMDLLSRI